MDELQIIDDLINNIINFIEVPHPALAGLPVCPFAKKTRIKNLIDIKVIDFDIHEIDARIVDILKTQFDNPKKIIIFAHPDKSLDLEKFNQLASKYELRFPLMSVFCSHPMSEFKVNEIYVRRDPYPNLQFIFTKHLQESEAKLTPKYHSRRKKGKLP